MSTLREIAKHAGVSVSTASMAVRDHRSINIKTKQRVWEAQEKLGYRLNLRPRPVRAGVASGVKNIVFLLVGRQFDDPVYTQVFQGVARMAEAHNGRLIFTPASLSQLHKGTFPSVIQNREVDGIIVSGVYDEKAHRNLAKLGIPTVVFGNYKLGDEPWAACEFNLSQGMHLLTKRLADLGHLNFGMLFRNIQTEYEIKLQHWYLREINEGGYQNAGIALESEHGSFLKATHSLLDTPTRPTALVLATDTIVEDVYTACEQKNLRIPEDISIIAFGQNNYKVRPSLATVRSIGEDVGAIATEKLIRLIENPATIPTRELFPMCIVPGGSIAALSGS
ncbi:MAG: LacI family DNA-binding transcriptional regulator [Chthoniobacterales bacterium]